MAPRADILTNPPTFTLEHAQWVEAQVAAMGSSVYNVSNEANIAAEVNKVKGAKLIHDRLLAVLESQ